MYGSVASAIEAEARVSAREQNWTAVKRTQDGAVWSLRLSAANSDAQLDESLEGANAWWPGPPKGGAEILSVVPEENTVNLRFATSTPPDRGLLKIYPIRFLDSLAAVWRQNEDSYLSHLKQLAEVPSVKFAKLTPSRFPELRASQRKAFRLPSFQHSFLWGPPGTGKTYTLGALIAEFLLANPKARVLVLSTTNVAVDLLLLSVDTALERIAARNEQARDLRKKCRRIGTRFVANNYIGRNHLLPKANPSLLARMAGLEIERPAPEDAVCYNAWKTKYEEVQRALRAEAKDILRGSRLCAMTSTRAIWSYGDLKEFSPFDLVVLDEASQISIAHTGPLLPIGRRVLCAGDPKQLQPIVCSEDPDAQEWLGRSAFHRMNSAYENVEMLNEQSRMADPICTIVSKIFYDGKLRLSLVESSKPKWQQERRLSDLPQLGKNPVKLIHVKESGGYHVRYKGHIREESAQIVTQLVQTCLREDRDPNSILVLTPYRAQRTKIRTALREADIKGVHVTTVHRAQGGERRVVIMDPVLGTHKANTDLLINVGMSRAKARLVLLLSDEDRKNEVFARVSAICSRGAMPIAASGNASANRSKRPFADLRAGDRLTHAGRVYLYEGLTPDEEKVFLRDTETGEQKKFLMKYLLP